MDGDLSLERGSSDGGGIFLDGHEHEPDMVLAQSELVGRARGATVGHRKKSSLSERLFSCVRAYTI